MMINMTNFVLNEFFNHFLSKSGVSLHCYYCLEYEDRKPKFKIQTVQVAEDLSNEYRVPFGTSLK